jgi:predicted transcriptional regulator
MNVVLDEEHAQALQRLAERTGSSREEVARSLLAGALDASKQDAERLTSLLERIPGAAEAVREAERDVASDRAIPLDRL